ncbi:tetratricopeptide repeat protein [Magnetococcus sp. PR-3]|uniref:tetratricopeptide repeat protein n=1 Tax=Magnetococcus sp. PR-3 TaxID=3120355 RepID=UPI002FCDEF5A
MTLEEAFKQAAQWHKQGLLDQAESLYLQILNAAPEHPVVLYHLALISQMREDKVQFEARLLAVLAVDPQHQDGHRQLGTLYTGLQQLEKGAEHFQQAMSAGDESVTLLVNYGYNQLRQEQLEKAQALFEQALQQQPLDAAWDGLAKVCRARGDLSGADAAYAQALMLNPDSVAHLCNRALLLNQMERHREAEDLFREVLKRDPNLAEAHNGLGVLLRKTRRHLEARQHFEQALALEENFIAAHNNLANTLVDVGLADEAIVHFEQALALEENRDIRSNMLMCLNYTTHYTGPDLSKALRVWQQHHGRGFAEPHFLNNPDPHRRLKVGYISADLCQHPLGFFHLPLFENHDPQAVESYVYSSTVKHDWLTALCQKHVDHWYDLAGQPDEVVAQQIAEDGIDLLMDLSGHTRGNRMMLLVKGSAPVQILAGGCYSSNGIDRMDAVLADPYQIPEVLTSCFSEPLQYLPGYLNTVYAPPPYMPEVKPLPALNNGHITFGCCNNMAKINPEVIALWSKLLKRLPTSRLILRTHGLNGVQTQQRVMDTFAMHGVPAHQLQLDGGVAHAQLLAGYGDMDIALDPFPYSGGLTTIEALWMGVPVVALHGDRLAGRHSVGHLSIAGLEHWAVTSHQAYVDHAVAMASDLPALAQLRQGMRARMEASPLADGAGYAKAVEGVYRDLWQQWCHRSKK